jgi:hypothetical protein
MPTEDTDHITSMLDELKGKVRNNIRDEDAYAHGNITIEDVTNLVADDMITGRNFYA